MPARPHSMMRRALPRKSSRAAWIFAAVSPIWRSVRTIFDCKRFIGASTRFAAPAMRASSAPSAMPGAGLASDVTRNA